MVWVVAGLTATAVAQSAPTCVPASLNNSALQAGAVTISPLPGTRDASPQTQISFLGVPASELSVQSVTGSRSGAHSGRLKAYSQGNGASFLPARPFLPGERVTVKARLTVRRVRASDPRCLRHCRPRHDQLDAREDPPGTAAQEQHFRSRSDLRPPIVTRHGKQPRCRPGGHLRGALHGTGPGRPDDPRRRSGGLLWFKALPRNTFATDLRVQEYSGQPVLTWWQGNISVHGFGTGEGVIANGAYEDIAHVRAGNGHQVDLHELQVTPQGTALVTSYFPILCNLSSVGGASYSGLTDGVMQEIDIRTGLVMYEWTSLDHVALSESYASPKRSVPPYPYDFFHINSINLDRDGSLLISSRNTWAIYDVAASTGRINWRLGGQEEQLQSGARHAGRHGSTTPVNCPTARSACSTTAHRRPFILSRGGSSSA